MKTLIIKIVPDSYKGNKALTTQSDISVSKDNNGDYAIYIRYTDFISMSTKNYPNIKMIKILKNIVLGLLGNDKCISIEATAFLNKSQSASAGIIWTKKLAPLIDKDKQMRVPLLEDKKDKKDISKEVKEDIDNYTDYVTEIDGISVDPSVAKMLDMFGDVNYKSSKKSRKKKSTSSDNRWNKSKLIKNGKNRRMKKTYHKHGVIIYNDKDDFKSDVKTIKSFLKDFIPGDEKWQDDFRHDLLKRWTYAYAISKKQAKKLSKKFNSKSKLKDSTTKFILNGVEKVFSKPIDSWNDINK